MPELPEVETTKASLAPLLGQQVVDVKVFLAQSAPLIGLIGIVSSLMDPTIPKTLQLFLPFFFFLFFFFCS